jgi:signal transduction histidine kinase
VLCSLRVRILLMLFLVVVIAVGSVAILARRTTTGEFQQYVAYSGAMHSRRVGIMLGMFHVRYGSWTGVQPVVEQAAQVTGARIILTGADGRVVADSDGELVGQAVGRGAAGAAVPIAPQGVLVGTAYIAPPVSRAITTGEANFYGAVNRALWLAVLAAGGGAILLTVLFSRRILTPVEALTAATRRMAKGDLSQRVRVQSKDEIGELARAFNSMAEGLARLEQLRRHMVSDVAHELRAPLSGIRGYLEALREGVTAPTAPVITVVYEETMRLSRLVDDLQELTAADAGELKLARRPIVLAQVIKRVLNTCDPQMSAKGLATHVNIAPNVPMMEVDPERVEQILRNLLTNAITHTPPGGTVTVTVRTVGAEAEIRVEDTGVGVPPEDLPFIFERFYRADRSRTRSTGGTGLGLTIVKQLVEAHGGRVSAVSGLGKGTCIGFTLPLLAKG